MLAVRAVQIDGDHRLGLGVDHIDLPVADQHTLRSPQPVENCFHTGLPVRY